LVPQVPNKYQGEAKVPGLLIPLPLYVTVRSIPWGSLLTLGPPAYISPNLFADICPGDVIPLFGEKKKGGKKKKKVGRKKLRESRYREWISKKEQKREITVKNNHNDQNSSSILLPFIVNF